MGVGGAWEALDFFPVFGSFFSWVFGRESDNAGAELTENDGACKVKPLNGAMWAWDVILFACFHL